MFAGNAPYRLQRRASLLCDMQCIPSTILRIPLPFDQSSLFHFIDKNNQSACNHSQSRGERLLGDTRSRVEDPQKTGMLRSKVQFPQSLGKLRSTMSTALGT